MDKNTFVAYMKRLRYLKDVHDAKINTLKDVGFIQDNDEFEEMIYLMIDLLCEFFPNDEAITYFVYDRDFGRSQISCREENYFDDNGVIVELSSIEQFYDFLTR